MRGTSSAWMRGTSIAWMKGTSSALIRGTSSAWIRVTCSVKVICTLSPLMSGAHSASIWRIRGTSSAKMSVNQECLKLGD